MSETTNRLEERGKAPYIEMVKYCLHMTSKAQVKKKIKINVTTSNLKTSVQETIKHSEKTIYQIVENICKP